MEKITRAEAREKGLKYCFSGKPCKRGGIAPRFVSNNHCTCDACREVDRERAKEFGKHYRKTEEGKKSGRERTRRYRERNKERTLAEAKQWKEDNKEHIENWRKEYYWKNRDYIRSKWKVHYTENKEYHIRRALERRVKIKEVTPLWYDSNETVEIYKLADMLRDATGEDWDVDHMVPIKAKDACGLHWHGNLQVIPATLNRSKGNKMKYTGYLDWLDDYGRPLYSPVSFRVARDGQINEIKG